MTTVPVVWLCGAPATGKSTVAWRLFHVVGDEGIGVGYVDIDQLGMMYPEPGSDPGRHRVQAAALAAVRPNYANAGAQAMIVSGVIDPVVGADIAREHPAIAFCHLRASEDTIRTRMTRRASDPATVDAAVALQRGLDDAGFFARTIGTDGRTPEDVAAEVRSLVRPRSSPPDASQPKLAEGTGHLTVVCGPRAVGKSSVSWELFTRSIDRGIRTGYADIEQLGFLRCPGRNGSHLRIINLAALWNTFRPLGTASFIANGRVSADDARRIRAHFPTATIRLVRLSADPDTYRDRIRRRQYGGPARLAGDDLENATAEEQARVLEEALTADNACRTADPADEVVDTTTLSIGQVADLVR